jgi:alkylated DNA repair dioxygenase AlkB
MRTLFPLAASNELPDIPGLVYVPNFITAEEEETLAAAIDCAAWDTTWDRRRQPYGASYGSIAAPPAPIPSWGLALGTRIGEAGYSSQPFDQMLVNEYLPGQGIALHRDYDPFDRTVASVSLLAPVVMDFRELATGRQEALLLARRSLLILSDDARYAWQHGIARRKSDRWQGVRMPRSRRLSITFRTLRK